jgi:acetoacetyl-CoA synthetase
MPMWRPSVGRAERARITAFQAWLERERGLAFADYESLWRWSVTDLEGFWSAVWHFFDIRASVPYERVLGRRSMPGAEWFPGARLNVADQAFRQATDARCAIVAGDETGALREVSWRDLERQVASLAASLRALGVVPGDRVVAILPNVPQTIVAFLACASVGAVWSVCSPDMGPVAVLDRFRQIAPKPAPRCRRSRTPCSCRISTPPWTRRGFPAQSRGSGLSPATRRCAPSRSRPTTRCGSSTRPARPACRRRSCTATRARWSRC